MEIQNDHISHKARPQPVHHLRLPKVGMRIIKTALAIFLTLIFSNIILREVLRFDYIDGTIAVISVVLTIQDSIRSTIRSAFERVAGNLIGIVVGLGFLALDILLGRIDLLFYIFASVGTVVVIYICKLAKYVSLSSLAVVVFLSILFARSSAEPYFEALIRIFETVIGVGIALLVNIFIYPPKLVKLPADQLPTLQNDVSYSKADNTLKESLK